MPDLLLTYMRSRKAQVALAAFQKARLGSGVTLTVEITTAQNYLLVNILLSNACRAGCVLAITHGHVRQAICDPTTGVQTITVNK